MIDIKVSDEDFGYQNIIDFPVWAYDLDAEVFSPLLNLEKKISCIEDLFFRAKYFTLQGIEFVGFINGDKGHAFTIFRNNRGYAGNNSAKDISMAQMTQLLEDSVGLKITSPQDIFPLRFKTDINMEPYIDWEGVIDLN